MFYTQTEPLTDQELNLIKMKNRDEWTNLLNIGKVLIGLSILIPYLLPKIFNSFNPKPYSETLWTDLSFLIPSAYLIGFSLLLLTLAYLWNVYPGYRDLKSGFKIIEQATILRKVYIALDGHYYFYLNSSTRLSIEVTSVDYFKRQIGDEICIEYTTYSKFYLSYY